MRTIAVINLKGGVAKTVTTNSVAYILASQGNKVLIVDNDNTGWRGNRSDHDCKAPGRLDEKTDQTYGIP